MWEMGHSFDEIDSLSISDLGDVLGYWHENAKADERLDKKRKHLNKNV